MEKSSILVSGKGDQRQEGEGEHECSLTQLRVQLVVMRELGTRNFPLKVDAPDALAAFIARSGPFWLRLF